MPYVELHAHSAFSFLDGASLPEELVATALERGHTAMALTDHNTVSGSMEFAQAAGSLGLRAIHGAEVDLADPREARARTRHVTLLVRDAAGWRNLCRLLTRAHAHTRETPGRRKVLEPVVTLEDLAEHAEGLVCLSGCARRGVHDAPTLRALRRAFGAEGLRVELQRPFGRRDRARNRELAALAADVGVACVATGDVHAHCAERARLQDAFVAIREHTTLDASEPLRRGNHSHVLTTPEAMAARFEDHPDAVAESARLAATLTFDLTADLGYRYPGAEDDAADRALAEICAARFDVRYPQGHRLRSAATARLEDELRLIDGLGLSGFFVLHHDLLELAREVAAEVRGTDTARSLLPPGRGRGSSVSSIVCYLTGLSHVDPIANDLFLGRFLNEEITTLPDIDLDFPRDVREVLIPRVHERYGHERSALVAAFPTYRARGAIRELGKALGLPPGEIERVARSSEAWSAETVDQDIAVALGEGRQAEGRWRWLHELAHEAHGLPRHLSQHSGGMVVATRPLIDCCAVVPAAMEGRQMVMWDKDSCSDAGFLKIDLLGLGMLSAVERCVEMIGARRHERIDLSRIPMDDRETFRCIQEAETTGVFQIESRAQMGSLRRTRPETLEDLTIQVAIVRPGPIVGGAVNPYIERRQRLREDPSFRVPYDHPSLEPVLKDTLGTIIFQDQVIEVAMAFAGFSPGEAEGLRRAMSRKRSAAAIEAYHDRFVARATALWEGGAPEEAVTPELGERVWTMVKGFSGFGFPKAHGAAFGLLAYQSTWLRVHYGPEFLAALLDEQPMGFYPSDALVHEAQRRGIEVLAPDVNASAAGCTVTGEGAVRIGLGYVLGVRGDDVAALVAARDAAGPFRSVEDLASRAGAGRAALEQLAWSGACDALAGGDRRRALWELGVAAPGVRLLPPRSSTAGIPTTALEARARAERAGAAARAGAAGALGAEGTRAGAAALGAEAARAGAAGALGAEGTRAGAAALGAEAARAGAAGALGAEGTRAGAAALGAEAARAGAAGALGAEGTRAGAAALGAEAARAGAAGALGAEGAGAQGGGASSAGGSRAPRFSSAAAAARAAASRREIGVQLSLPLGVGDAPELPALGGWDAMIADYATTGLTVGRHPLGLLRDELRDRGMVSSGELAGLPHGRAVRLGGLVVARQRPGTAKGVCFMLLEDEDGTVNLVVPPSVYERDRVVVRAEPLVVADGVLERHASAGGAINVVCKRLQRLGASGHLESRPVEFDKNFAIVGGAERPAATVKDFSPLDARELARRRAEEDAAREAAAATGTDDFRAVAPPVQSFANGRRR